MERQSPGPQGRVFSYAEGGIGMGKETVLPGLRRELTRETFEELVALQCEPEEITGYAGVTLCDLDGWCVSVYGRPLAEMMEMIRKDGLIAIRRASFEQLKKSATVISQQYNRFLPAARTDERAGAEEAIRALTAAAEPAEGEIGALFSGEGGD